MTQLAGAAVAAFALLAGGMGLAHSQTAADPNAAYPNDVVTVRRGDYGIAGLVTHMQGAKDFKHAVALFPGFPGILKLASVDGQAVFDLRGNFLVRSRRHWLEPDTLTVLVDAPSDQWGNFHQSFRESARYGADVEALLDEVSRRYGVSDWTFVGTSEGSVSAFHAARMNPARPRRVILTASLFQGTRNGPGLSGVDWSTLKMPLLWVHHEKDPCSVTSYVEAQDAARKTGKPLLTVRGGGPERGNACDAYTAHGFVGVERETVRAMSSWVRTGVTPADVGAP